MTRLVLHLYVTANGQGLEYLGERLVAPSTKSRMGFARLGDPGTRAHAARTWGTPKGMWYKEPGFLGDALPILSVAGAEAHHFSTLYGPTESRALIQNRRFSQPVKPRHNKEGSYVGIDCLEPEFAGTIGTLARAVAFSHIWPESGQIWGTLLRDKESPHQPNNADSKREFFRSL
jgi:hypothetical protein